MWEIECFKEYVAVGFKEKKIDGGIGGSYTYHLTVGYIQSVNEVRVEMIQ